MINIIPRASIIPFCVPAELAIRNATQEVEKLGADTRLTDAVILLDEARRLVSEYIDEQIKNCIS